LILNPAIITLIAVSMLITAYAVYASLFGLQIIRHWDMRSGSERQLRLERRTHLISTVVSHLFGLVLFSSFLFIYTGDHLHRLFVGAMCAAGTLNVNAYGYPLLVVKVLNFFLCGLWLILNATDGQGADYPLIRPKYRFLMAITGMMVVETVLTLNYFGALEADVITSCCGTLFSSDTDTVAGGLAAMPSYATSVVLFLGVVMLLRVGIHLVVTGRGARMFGWISAGLLVVGIVAVISVISVYYYELPTHHCPFCLLQAEYHYIGYPLYLALFIGGITGTGVGVIDRYRCTPSLRLAVPRLQKRLCLWSMAGYIGFAVIAAYPMIFSDFKLTGY
jgi:hypothetical protein